jgi:hypothetical protein
MPLDTTTHGVFRIDGQWATSIRFRLHEEDGQARRVDLQFNNDNTRIVKVTLDPDQARALLGKRNYANLQSASTVDRPPKGQDPGIVTRSGRLHGESLAYRDAVWHASPQEPENSIGPTAPWRDTSTQEKTEHAKTLQAHDAIVGAAHAAQMSGVGGAAMHAAAQAIGAADAAKVAADLARDEPVRPIDAAAAAASMTMASGAGGDAVQAAAKAVAAGAAIDTAQRAANTAKDAASHVGDTTGTPDPAQDSAPKKTSDKEREDEARRRRALQSAVPDAVQQRFVRVKDNYYFPDQTLAFSDHGGRLKSKSENLEVIRSLVAIAEAREWWSVTVSGSERFRRDVWREGIRQGIEVHGYTPTDVERAQLRRSLGMPEPVAKDPTGKPAAPAPDKDPVSQDRDENKAREREQPASRLTTGVMVAHGAAPYRFDASKGVSYHVILRTADGDKTLWGVDLERAIVESHSSVTVGDEVTVENRGSAAVTLKVPRRDKRSGAVIGHDEVATHRNSWRIETTAHLAQLRQAAETLRRTEYFDKAAVQSTPQLLDAMVGVWLSEQFAQRHVADPADRERMVEQVKARLAAAVERGESVTGLQLRRDLDRVFKGAHAPGAPSPATPQRVAPQREAEEPPYVHVH